MYPHGCTPYAAELWLQEQGVWGQINATLRPVLMQLWEQGYTQGLTLSGRTLAPVVVAGNVALLAGAWLAQIVRTTISLIAKALIAGTAIALGDAARAHLIATTEATRSIEQAVADSYMAEGVTEVRWIAGGPNPCQTCLDNQAAGVRQLGVPFPSGALVPPGHPDCHCHIERA